jgi:hypothetical protein
MGFVELFELLPRLTYSLSIRSVHDKRMRSSKWIAITALLPLSLWGETLGFLEQRFVSLNFEKGKWDRTEKSSCYVYTARENGSLVEVMRYGTSNLVPFRGSKGLTVNVCASTAAFDEGFEARAKP